MLGSPARSQWFWFLSLCPLQLGLPKASFPSVSLVWSALPACRRCVAEVTIFLWWSLDGLILFSTCLNCTEVEIWEEFFWKSSKYSYFINFFLNKEELLFKLWLSSSLVCRSWITHRRYVKFYKIKNAAEWFQDLSFIPSDLNVGMLMPLVLFKAEKIVYVQRLHWALEKKIKTERLLKSQSLLACFVTIGAVCKEMFISGITTAYLVT